MSETNSEPKRPAQRRRALAGGRNHKVVASEFPKFLVRLVGWRKMRLTRTEPRPRYRHD